MCSQVRYFWEDPLWTEPWRHFDEAAGRTPEEAMRTDGETGKGLCCR